jgi:hypothetical protein
MVFHVRYCAINDIDPEISYRYICQYGEWFMTQESWK